MSTEDTEALTSSWFVLSLIAIFIFPIVGVPVMLWLGFGEKTNSKAINIAARVIGVIGLFIAAAIFVLLYYISRLNPMD